LLDFQASLAQLIGEYLAVIYFNIRLNMNAQNDNSQPELLDKKNFDSVAQALVAEVIIVKVKTCLFNRGKV